MNNRKDGLLMKFTKILSGLIIMAALLSFTACNNTTDPSASATATPGPTTVIFPSEARGKIVATKEEDLDGDGTMENIKLKGYAINTSDGTFSYFGVIVNDNGDDKLDDNEAIFKGKGQNVDGEIYIEDLDSSDNQKEIVISAPGSIHGTYPETFVLVYDKANNKLNLAGDIKGIIGEIKGDKKIDTKSYSNFLEEHWYDASYTFENNKLVEVPQETYAYEKLPVAAAKPFAVYKDKNITDDSGKIIGEKAGTINTGDKVYIVESDHKEYVKLSKEDGSVTGWLKLITLPTTFYQDSDRNKQYAIAGLYSDDKDDSNDTTIHDLLPNLIHQRATDPRESAE